MDIKKVIKEWMLPIAMVTGASIYLLYHMMPESVHKAGPFLAAALSVLQPLLIFAMLFLTFCRIEPRDLKPHRWHWWLLLIQGGSFVALAFVILGLVRWFPGDHQATIILIESAMLCMICPTATAAAVVTRKLGGDVAGITTYVVLINLLAAVLVPLIVPMIQPVAGMSFWDAFRLILAKVFPLLITPCLAAWLVRYLLPKAHSWLLKYQDLPFYIWAVALTLAIAVTVKAIVHSTLSLKLLLMMSAVSLVCCAFQFALGRFVGAHYRPHRSPARHRRHQKYQNVDDAVEASRMYEVEAMAKEARKVTAGQSLGQKNTVFAIWLAYTFMTPETAIIGGLYSVWHNLYNSWQLYRAGKK